MGIFGKLGGGREISLSSQGSLLLAAITMVAADGDVDDDELAIIRRLDGSGHTKDWDDAVKAWKTKSTAECIEMVTGTLNQEQQLTAMANLVDIAMADGILAGAEKTLLEAYLEAFDIEEDDVETIVHVISVKNNKELFKG